MMDLRLVTVFVVIGAAVAADDCPNARDGVSFGCEGEAVCIRWVVNRNESITKIAVMRMRDDQKYVSWVWNETIERLDKRASLMWDKESKTNYITFTLQNISHADNGTLKLQVYFRRPNITHFTHFPYSTGLNVLKACPDRQMYRHPRVVYRTNSSVEMKVEGDLVELSEPGNVTLGVTIPAADPPVTALIASGQASHSCTGTAGNHSRCEAEFFLGETADSKVNVTLKYVYWETSSTIIDVQMIYPTQVRGHQPTSTPQQSASSDKLKSRGAIAGYALAAVILVGGICVGLLIYFLRDKKRYCFKKGEEALSPNEMERLNKSANTRPEIPKEVDNYLRMLSALVRENIHREQKNSNLKLSSLSTDSEHSFYFELTMVIDNPRNSENPEMEGYQWRIAEQLNSTNTITIDKMFSHEHGGQKPSRVLLVAGAGMGKTTVSNEHTLDLAKDESGEIRAIYHFKCCQLASNIKSNKQYSLVDLLFLMHGPGDLPEGDKDTVINFLKSNQSCIHITIDGLDELPQWETCIDSDPPMISEMNVKAQVPEIIYNLITKRLLPQANVLVTSRHSASLRKGDFNRVIRIICFPEDSIKQCLQAMCETGREYQAIIAYIEQYDLLVYCAVPLICKLLGAILRWQIPRGTVGEIDSMTRVFTRLLQEFIFRKQSNPADLYDPTRAVFNQNQRQDLLKLATLAAIGMLGEDTIVKFERSHLTAAKMKPKIEHFGLLVLEPEKRAYPFASFTKRDIAYFPHLSVQEFLAALHVCVAGVDVSKLTQPGEDRLDMVREFVAGLLGDPACRLLVGALNPKIGDTTLTNRANDLVLGLAGRMVDSTDRKSNILLTLRCVREGKVRELIPELQNSHHSRIARNQTLDLSETPGGLLPKDLDAVRYFLEACHECTRLNLRKNFITRQGLSSLASGGERLTTLMLSNNEFGDEGIKALEPFLSSCRDLDTLVLSSCKIGDKGASQLAHTLADKGTIRELWLCENNIGDEGATKLADALIESRFLQNLMLSENCIGNNGAAALAHTLRQCNTLLKIRLSGNKLDYQTGRNLKQEFGERVELADASAQ